MTLKKTGKNVRALLIALAILSFVFRLSLPLGDLAPPAVAADYNRQCGVTGGSAQQLSSVLSACGYSGTVSLQELTVRNPDSAANDLYFGQSDVNSSNGFKLAPGESMTWRASDRSDVIDAGRVYLFVSSTQNAALSLRSK